MLDMILKSPVIIGGTAIPMCIQAAENLRVADQLHECPAHP